MRNPMGQAAHRGRVLATVAVVLMAGGSLVLGEPPRNARQSETGRKAKEEPTAKDKSAQPGFPSLEDMLAKALKDNPDIRVAEAKLREADAELNRIRLRVTQKVVAVQHDRESQKSVLEQAEARLKRLLKLGESAQLGQEEVDAARALLAQEKAKMAAIEAEMPYLLGKPPHRGVAAVDDDRDRLLVDIFLQTLGRSRPVRLDAARSLRLKPPVAGTMADKVRKALDTPVTFEVKENLREVLKELQRKAPGVTIQLSAPNLEQEAVTLHVEELPLGAALQAIEDMFAGSHSRNATEDEIKDNPSLRIAIREYGILLIPEDRLPPGALLLEEFWKGTAGKEGPKERGRTGDVEGLVKASDPKVGFVTLNIGSDAGIEKGQTLEVYRLKPRPDYVGMIRIVEVHAQKAVGRAILPLRAGPVQVGDKVTNRLLGKR